MGRYPTALDLDSVDSERPILLYHSSIHICVVNTKALEIAGFNKDTKCEGGSIDLCPAGHELAGQPTGVLRETIIDELVKIIPRSSNKIKQDIKIALYECIQNGITSMHCLDADVWNEIAELAEDGEMPNHCFFAMFSTDINSNNRPKTSGESHGTMLKCSCLKIFVDGALGSETAAVIEPYTKKLSGGKDNYGILYHSQEALNQMVRNANDEGFQLEIHVIGDRAAEAAMEALEASNVPPSRRPIFVHCQLLNRSLIDRFILYFEIKV